MDRQTEVDWTKCEIREHLRNCELSGAEIGFVVLAYEQGTRRVQGETEVIEFTVSLRGAAESMGCAPNTVRAATERLVERGLLAIARFGRGATTYVLHWLGVRSLEPPENPLADPALFEGVLDPSTDPARSSAQQCAAVCKSTVSVKRVSKIRVPCIRDRESVTRGAVEHSRPWRDATHADLVAAVADDARGGLVWRLFKEGVAAGWWSDTPDNRLRFLMICHHAASPGVQNAMAVLVRRAKDGLNVDRIRQVHEDWARRRLQPCDESLIEANDQ